MIRENFFIIFSLFVFVSADVKSWTRNLNFQNPDNWDNQRGPCPLDTVIIPEVASSIFLQMNGTLKEIILPINGQIVLGSNQRLLFSDDQNVDTSCQGEDITFSRSGPAEWMNPNNWKSASGPILVESEQLPCRFDEVVFPSDTQFSISLDQTQNVSKVTFDGQVYTSSDALSAFLDSTIGRQQFSLSNSAQILVNGGGCADATGCTCGHNDIQTLEKICSYQTCSNLACSNAPKPLGGCCPVCGAILHMKYSNSFDFERIKQILMDRYIFKDQSINKVKRQLGTSVLMYMSKADKQIVQVVVTDTLSGSDSGVEAIVIAQQIETDLTNNAESYGVSDVTMESSTRGTGKNTGGNMTGGITVGIVLLILLVVVVGSSIFYVMFRRSNSLSIRFKRDEPLNAMDIELSSKTAIEDVMPTCENGDMVLGFDNPMYDTPGKELYADPAVVGKLPTDIPEIEEKGAIPDEEEDMEGFTNPLSGTFETET